MEQTQKATCARGRILRLTLLGILAAALALLLVPMRAQAATWAVTSTNDSGAGSLRQAVLDAADGDEIIFHALLDGQTISQSSGLTMDKNLTFRTADQNNAVTVSMTDPADTVTVSTGKTATFTRGNMIFGTIIAGGGTLTVNGNTAALTLEKPCSFSGSVSVENGLLALRAGGSLGNAASVTVNNAGAIYLDMSATAAEIQNLSGAGMLQVYGPLKLKNSAAAEFSGAISGSSALTVQNSGHMLTLSGDNSGYQGRLTMEGNLTFTTEEALGAEVSPLALNAGTLTFGAADIVLNRNINLGGPVVLITDQYHGEITGSLTGSGTVNKRGSGTLLLSGSTMFTGGFSVFEGTLALSGGADLGAASNLLILNGGMLEIRKDLTILATQALALDYGGGTIDTGNYTCSIEGMVSGMGELRKVGAGTLQLYGFNVNSGGITVTGGTLEINRDEALGVAGNVLTLDGGRLDMSGAMMTLTGHPLILGPGGGAVDGNSNSIESVISGPGALTVESNLSFRGANTYTGGTVVKTGAMLALEDDENLGAAGGPLTLDGGTLLNLMPLTLSAGRVVSVQGSGTVIAGAALTVRSALSGSGALTFSGSYPVEIEGPLAPGTASAAGKLTIKDTTSQACIGQSGGARYVFDLKSGSNYDQLDLQGILSANISPAPVEITTWSNGTFALIQSDNELDLNSFPLKGQPSIGDAELSLSADKKTLYLTVTGYREPSKPTYVITLQPRNGLGGYKQTIEQGDTVKKPADPHYGDHRFLGWFTDFACTKAYDFSTPVKADGTLYAGWENVSAPEWNNPFTDVVKGKWYYGSVAYVHTNGLMQGTSPTTFTPGGTVSRGMLVTTLWRDAGSPVSGGTSAFTDVKIDSYYKAAVEWAVENSIVNGYSPVKFGPDDPVTREQLAVMVARYARYRGEDIPGETNPSGFGDAAAISSWAQDSVNYLKQSGILQGRPGNTFDPKGDTSRAEIATILERYLETYN